MIFVVVLSVLVATIIAKLYIPQAIVNWDESVYLNFAYQIYHSIRIGSLPDFWKNTLAQFGYAPLQSWTIAFPLVPFDFSIQAARIAGLFWFILSTIVIYSFGKILNRK